MRQLIRGGKLFIFHVEKDHRALIISIDKSHFLLLVEKREGGGVSLHWEDTEGFKGWSLICNIDKRESIDLNISCIILSRSPLVCFTYKEKFQHLKWEVQTARREGGELDFVENWIFVKILSGIFSLSARKYSQHIRIVLSPRKTSSVAEISAGCDINIKLKTYLDTTPYKANINVVPPLHNLADITTLLLLITFKYYEYRNFLPFTIFDKYSVFGNISSVSFY